MLCKCGKCWWVYPARMSPTINRSSMLECFEQSNRVMFDFYLGLPHIHIYQHIHTPHDPSSLLHTPTHLSLLHTHTQPYYTHTHTQTRTHHHPPTYTHTCIPPTPTPTHLHTHHHPPTYTTHMHSTHTHTHTHTHTYQFLEETVSVLAVFQWTHFPTVIHHIRTQQYLVFVWIVYYNLYYNCTVLIN